jgi:cysteine desulfurase
MTAAARAAVAQGMVDWANPSSPHAEGRRARAQVETARAAVAAAYAWTGETLFTSGASESLAIALGRAPATRVLVSAVEHDAVVRAAGRATSIPVRADGQVDADALARLLAGDGRALVGIQWANSETGVRQPVAELAAIVHGAGGLLLVDAAQMPAGADACRLPAGAGGGLAAGAGGDVAAHADFVALSAHKRGGPPGVGALLVRDLATLSPSGGQERGYRAGTENLPGLLGYAAALGEPEPDHAALRATLDDAIRRSGGEVVGEESPRHPAIGAYRLPGVASATQLIRLDMAGFAVSAGSACASGSLKPSHVLAAMGWSETAGREVVRVSFGRTTTAADVAAFVAAWREVARATRRFVA